MPGLGWRKDDPTKDYWAKRRHVVYSFYNSDGDCIYIGATSDPYYRLYEHRRTSPWYGEVARLRIKLYPTRMEAFRAEREAIEAKQPRHNRQYTEAFREAERQRRRARRTA